MDEPPFAFVRLALPASIVAKGGSFFTVSTLVLFSSTSIACGFLVNTRKRPPFGDLFRQAEGGCCKTEVEQQPPLFVKSRIGRDFFKNFRRNSLQIILSRRSKAELSAMRKPGILCFFRCHKYLLFFERKKMCFPSVLSQFGAVLVQIKGQTQQKQFQRDVGFPSHKEAFELAVAF